MAATSPKKSKLQKEEETEMDPFNIGPAGRSGHCMTADEVNLYVFGGYSPKDERNHMDRNRVLPELWKFNFATQLWSKIDADEIPDTCASSCLKLNNKTLFVYGGTGYPFGQVMSNTIKTLRLTPSGQPAGINRSRDSVTGLSASGETIPSRPRKSKSCWHLMESNPSSYSCQGNDDMMPPPAYGQSFIIHEDSIYVFGGAVGYYNEAVSELHRLSIETMAWEKLSPTGTVPTGRYKQEVARDDSRFYVFGGGRLYYSEDLSKIHAYNFSRNHWDLLQTKPDRKYGFPKSRCSFGLAQTGSHVYITGGRHYSQTVDHRSLHDIWLFRLDKLKWKRLPFSLPEPLYFHSTALAPNGDLYIFGGVLRDGYRTPNLIKTRMGFHIPKLTELAWGKVTSSIQDIHKQTQADLADLGIPWNFCERVSVQ